MKLSKALLRRLRWWASWGHPKSTETAPRYVLQSLASDVERGFVSGTGDLLRITDAGRAALAEEGGTE